MRHSFGLILFALLTVSHALFAEPTDKSEEIELLNTQSVENLGISLLALSALIEYSNKRFSECYMRATGSYSSVEELVSAGYVTVEKQEPIKGLEGQTFSKLAFTEKGQSILRQIERYRSSPDADKSCN